MKNARPSKAESSVIPGRNNAILSYPPRKASACAEVLARLLAGEVLTSSDTLDKCATMRAAAHVDYLEKRYAWPVVSDRRAAGCTDGRVTIVAVYRLPQETIAAARADGAAAWCAEVRKARAALRAKAAEAYRRAAALNKARNKTPPPGQSGLFDGV